MPNKELQSMQVSCPVLSPSTAPSTPGLRPLQQSTSSQPFSRVYERFLTPAAPGFSRFVVGFYRSDMIVEVNFCLDHRISGSVRAAFCVVQERAHPCHGPGGSHALQFIGEPLFSWWFASCRCPKKCDCNFDFGAILFGRS